MSNASPSEQSILAENAGLRARLAEMEARLREAEETLSAIHEGKVDAFVVESPAGPRLFTLQGADAESNRFRGEMLAQVSDAVIAVDAGQRVIYLNAAAEGKYGISASEALGRRLGELYECRWLRPGEAAEFTAALCDTGQWRGEAIHIKRNGEAMHVESSVSRLRAPDGADRGHIAVIRDITERKQAEEALVASQARYRDLAESIPGDALGRRRSRRHDRS